MATRRWQWRGFGLGLTIPDALVRFARDRRSPTDRTPAGHGLPEATAASGSGVVGLKFRPPPPLKAAKRDATAALAFLGDFAERAGSTREDIHQDGAQDAAASRPFRSDDLAARVAALSWYHTIEMPGGVVSRGMFDHRPLVAHYGIPDTLAGLKCLDVACSHGFWAFEFERRGGIVTALDIGSWSDWDLPVGAPTPFAGNEQPDDDAPAQEDAFLLAREALGSSVQRVQQNLYGMDPDSLGRFDFVHIADVLLHLARPLDALRAVRAVTAPGGTALIADVVDLELDDPTLTRYYGGFASLLWWMPSLDCLAQMVYDAGFVEVDLVALYNLAPWDLTEGSWRAVFLARP